MIKVPQIPFRRRRKSTAGSAAVIVPLAMTSATITSFVGGDMVVSLAFDNDADDPMAPLPGGVEAAWTATYEGVLYVGSVIAIATPTTLTLTLVADGESGSPNGITYDPQEPAYIETENGRVLGAFADVPFEQ